MVILEKIDAYRRLFPPFPYLLIYCPEEVASFEARQVHQNTPTDGGLWIKMPTYMDFGLWNEWEV